MNMRVAFRVDASAQIGTGHLKRCLSLAHAIQELGGEVSFVWRDHGLDCHSQIEARGCQSFQLSRPAGESRLSGGPAHAAWAGVPAEQDVADTIAELIFWRPDWLVVDHYGFDAAWHSAVRQGLGCQLMVIDDLGDRPVHADILVDHNPHADHRAKYESSRTSIGRLLGGARFALLDADYRVLKPITVNEAVRSIGVFMGGVDGGKHSLLAIGACRAAGFEGRIEVVSTSANPHLAQLSAAVAGDPGTSLLLDLPSLAGFFASHDVQIGAGGGATWERCRAGVPALVLATARNQTVVTGALCEAGAALTLDAPLHESVQDCVVTLLSDYALRASLAERARTLVDGRGCERVALSMTRNQVLIRRAADEDAHLIYRWRNHPATRAMSEDQAAIDLEGHLLWFAASVAPDSGRLIFVGQIGPIPIGVVRFDRVAPKGETKQYIVSIYLDPDLHGLGLGPPLLAAAERALVTSTRSAARIVAVTRPENAASQAMFRSCGYLGTQEFVKDLPAADRRSRQ